MSLEACEKYGETYAGTAIDRAVFGNTGSSSTFCRQFFDVSDFNLEISTVPDEKTQLENRRRGFLYLKNLCGTLTTTKLNFEAESKWKGMTPGEVEFIEDIHNLQNFKPIMVPALEKESTKT